MPVEDTRSQVTGKCTCCGSKTRAATGTAVFGNDDAALYVARWTEREPGHGIAFLLTLFELGTFVSVLYSFENESFMIVGPEGYEWDLSDEMVVLKREQVIGTPLAPRVFSALDEIWLHDKSLREFHQEWNRR